MVIQTALERKAHASAVEQALIDAFATRYEAEPDPDRRRSLDSLYAREMEDGVGYHPLKKFR